MQESRGYICPLGQICTVCRLFIVLRTFVNPFFEQEAPNPFNNLESFDAIYYAALQVVIVAGANGVSGHQLITYPSRQC